ncbi:M12 family metallo-peptidase [Chryseobacterium paridis]|uniref:Zinc-dependent metalloprotease n=1 Tax=Chryseobacterium paridis TaxID=2800328 RepID=A0ABS1G035_9FLAO|nr:M12 family metallo-peptidase [Chryseobacterium paridis]MBK1898002.1 zinc-dependent metalloprotease [Chryseobacterium paridis]
MKTKFTTLVLFCATLCSAQNKIFQTSIAEGTLKNNQKVSKELSSTYLATKYYSQSPFNLRANLQISLPSGKEITAKFSRMFTYSNKSESYVYTIENDPKAELVLSQYDHVVTGMYASGTGEKVMFHQTDNNIFAISEVSDTRMINQDSIDDYVLEKTESFNKANSNVCLSTTPVCSASRIDVLIVFTTAAKNAWGGLSQSNSFVATAITNFNTALTNSGVSNVTINLVYSGEISYTESGNLSTDLPRLRNNNDGYMDDVHTLRTTYGADLCALVTATPTNTCGLGYVNTSSTNYSINSGYCVSLYNCAVSNYSLAHELGHNMGLRHDWYVDSSTTPCDHHHGYTNKKAIDLGSSSTSSQRWRTIMAYNDECSSKGFNCTRINRWANPSVNYNSDPTGVAIGSTKPANEAFGFARFACVVSNFMPETQSFLSTQEEIPVAKQQFQLYPNPTHDVINISGDRGGKYTFKIYNPSGQNILTTSERTISVKGLVAGEYFVSIYDEKNTLIENKKFIVR